MVGPAWRLPRVVWCAVLLATAGGGAPARGEVHLAQYPHQFSCGFAHQDQQSIAEDFVTAGPVEIGHAAFWGGYFPDDVAGSDSFTVRLLAAQGNVPGALISQATLAGVTRVATGRTLFDIAEYRYTLEIDPPLQVPSAGTFFLEIFNDPAGTADTFCLEGAFHDPDTGIDGDGFSFTTPGVVWMRAISDVALIVGGPGVLFVDGFETGDPSSWSAAAP